MAGETVPTWSREENKSRKQCEKLTRQEKKLRNNSIDAS